MAWLFAFWRSVTARKQADTVNKEYHSKRLRDARTALMSKNTTSQERVSAIHELSYVVVDAPELGLQAFEHISAFIAQAPPPDTEENDYTEDEYRAADISAQFIARKVVDAQVLGGSVDSYRGMLRDLRHFRLGAQLEGKIARDGVP